MDGQTQSITLQAASRPLDARRIQKLRSMILAILDEPIEDESANKQFFRLSERRLLASLLEPLPLQ